MKKIIFCLLIATPYTLFSQKKQDTTTLKKDSIATLKISKQRYDAITLMLAQSELYTDSVFVGLSYFNVPVKMSSQIRFSSKAAETVRLYIMQQLDSVFYPKPKIKNK